MIIGRKLWRQKLDDNMENPAICWVSRYHFRLYGVAYQYLPGEVWG